MVDAPYEGGHPILGWFFYGIFFYTHQHNLNTEFIASTDAGWMDDAFRVHDRRLERAAAIQGGAARIIYAPL